MVDFNFLNKDEKAEPPSMAPIEEKLPPGRIEFMDIDLPAKTGGDTKSPLELAKLKMIEGDQLIANMKEEADGFKESGETGLAKLNEMVGQVKKLDDKLEQATKKYSDPYYKKYKDIRNIYTPRSTKLGQVKSILQRKLNQVANEVRLERQKEQQKIRDEAAKLQEKIDKDQAELRRQEKKAAKKEEREPVYSAPILIDMPVLPTKTKIVTESGSTIIDTELVAKIQDLGSKFILQMVLNYRRDKYSEIAEKALKDAIDGGVLGLKGAEGVTVTEETVAGHRRRG